MVDAEHGEGGVYGEANGRLLGHEQVKNAVRREVFNPACRTAAQAEKVRKVQRPIYR